MFGLCSDYVRSDYPRNVAESSFYWRKQFTEFSELTDFVADAVFGEVGG